MRSLIVRCFDNRGQMKIQQMAFVLVVTMIFFSLVALFYFSFNVKTIQKGAGTLEDEKAKELVRQLAGTPEFRFDVAGSCASCVDADKILLLKERESYKDFWQLDYLAVEKIYPKVNRSGECTSGNYPECNMITIIKSNDFRTSEEAFVSLCRYDNRFEGFFKCELGKIYASGRALR